MDLIKNILGTILFEIAPIIFLLWLLIARPIIEKLDAISAKLDKLTEQNHDKPE